MTLEYDFSNNDANFSNGMLISPAFGIGLILKDCPVDDLIPGQWIVGDYNLLTSPGSEIEVEEHAHVLVVLKINTEIDRTNDSPPAGIETNPEEDLVTSDMDLTLLLDITLEWSDSDNNTPETYVVGQTSLRVWDCKATANGAWVRLPEGIDGYDGAGGVQVRWYPENPPESYVAAAISIVDQDDIKVGPIGPTASTSATVSWTAGAGDATVVMGPLTNALGQNGFVTSITANPTFGFANWEGISGYGYIHIGVSSQFSAANFEVNYPDGLHATACLALMATVFRPD